MLSLDFLIHTFYVHTLPSSLSMEGGRQADVAKGILASKDIPYIVAAPLLIQVRG